MASKEALLGKLKAGVIKYQEEDVKEAARQVLEDGHDALEMIMNGLAAGMEIVGDLYNRNEYFVPEMLLCADALYAGLEVLRPHVVEQDTGIKAQIIIGTIEGDVHDIGKNLVKRSLGNV